MFQAIQLKRILFVGTKAMRCRRCILPALAFTSFVMHVAQAQEQRIEELSAVQSEPLDGTLYTSYNFSSDKKVVGWSVSGHVGPTFGSYGAGSLGPFVKVGALLEGNPSTNLSKKTVTRAIYVLDIASGSSRNGVVLYVYKKVDLISATEDKPTVSLEKKISLPLAGGESASASMAANDKYLYIGTNQSLEAVRVTKESFQVSMIGGGALNVSSITADQYGYVTITFGAFNTPQSGFVLYGPGGSDVAQGMGGGTPFSLSTIQATLPVTLP